MEFSDELANLKQGKQSSLPSFNNRTPTHPAASFDPLFRDASLKLFVYNRVPAKSLLKLLPSFSEVVKMFGWMSEKITYREKRKCWS